MTEVRPKGGIKPGVTVRIGGNDYVAPQLNFGALRRMREIPGAPKDANDPGSPTYQHDLLAFVLLESLKRNYDSVDAIWLNDTLDGSELAAAMEAIVEIMRASGLIAPRPDASGEATAAA